MAITGRIAFFGRPINQYIEIGTAMPPEALDT